MNVPASPLEAAAGPPGLEEIVEQQNAEGRPAIAAAVVVHEGRVLIVRRRVSEGRLSWQFPAGAVEPGEAREEAAVRFEPVQEHLDAVLERC